jgi:hypothetical protein
MSFTYHAEPADLAAAHVTASASRTSSRRDTRPLLTRLADTMLEIAGGGQTVDRNALALRGFTSTELSDENLAAARDRANRLATRRV